MKRKVWIFLMSLIALAATIATPTHVYAATCATNAKSPLCLAPGEGCGFNSSCCSVHCYDNVCQY